VRPELQRSINKAALGLPTVPLLPEERLEQREDALRCRRAGLEEREDLGGGEPGRELRPPLLEVVQHAERQGLDPRLKWAMAKKFPSLADYLDKDEGGSLKGLLDEF